MMRTESPAARRRNAIENGRVPRLRLAVCALGAVWWVAAMGVLGAIAAVLFACSGWASGVVASLAMIPMAWFGPWMLRELGTWACEQSTRALPLGRPDSAA